MLDIKDIVEYSKKINYKISNVTIFKIMKESGFETIRMKTPNGVYKFYWEDSALSAIDSYIEKKKSSKAEKRCRNCGNIMDDSAGRICSDCHAYFHVMKYCSEFPKINKEKLRKIKTVVDSLLNND